MQMAKSKKMRKSRTKPKRQSTAVRSVKRAPGKKAAATKSLKKKVARKQEKTRNQLAIRSRSRKARPDRQAGDLQGLSTRERADSESVDELLEEGNAFEADAVLGVEEADNADEREVRTHEVPQDDVPGEYLDKD